MKFVKLEQIEYEGNNFWVRPNTMDSSIVKEARVYEHHIVMDKKDRWLDGGANIGSFAVRYAPRVEFVLAVEPEKRNFEILEKNTRGFDNVTIKRIGLVADKREHITLYLNQARNPGSHSEFVQRGRPSKVIKAKNISELIHTWDINALKLDVEGAEYNLIMDMKPSAMKRLDKIVLEFHFAALKDKTRKMYKELLSELHMYFNYVKAKEPKDVMKHWHTIVTAWN